MSTFDPSTFSPANALTRESGLTLNVHTVGKYIDKHIETNDMSCFGKDAEKNVVKIKPTVSDNYRVALTASIESLVKKILSVAYMVSNKNTSNLTCINLNAINEAVLIDPSLKQYYIGHLAYWSPKGHYTESFQKNDDEISKLLHEINEGLYLSDPAKNYLFFLITWALSDIIDASFYLISYSKRVKFLRKTGSFAVKLKFNEELADTMVKAIESSSERWDKYKLVNKVEMEEIEKDVEENEMNIKPTHDYDEEEENETNNDEPIMDNEDIPVVKSFNPRKKKIPSPKKNN